MRSKKIILFLFLLSCCASLVNASEKTSIQLPKPLDDDDFHPVSEEAARLGQLLFYDRLLSGNRNIACATCHHPSLATTDGLSLGLGEGAEGLGEQRKAVKGTKLKHRVPRHSPVLFNLGAKEFTVFFHDGRLSIDKNDPTGFNSPAEEFLPSGLNHILAAQALFPLTSAVEMAGDINENQVAGAVRRRIDYAWRIIVERVRNTPDYAELFAKAFDDINTPTDIEIQHIANAIADFINFEWRADNSPFDRFLRGDKTAMTPQQQLGMSLFYGEAACSNCHSGALQTDHQFYSLALPQFGPGRTRRFDFKNRDMGRINETDLLEDAYQFRTPSLRNLEKSAPYGHNGAYNELEAIIRHHMDPLQALDNYDFGQLLLPTVDYLDTQLFLIQQDKREEAFLRKTVSPELAAIPDLSQVQMDAILAFLSSLNDEGSQLGRLGVPESVPSGLPVDKEIERKVAAQ